MRTKVSRDKIINIWHRGVCKQYDASFVQFQGLVVSVFGLLPGMPNALRNNQPNYNAAADCKRNEEKNQTQSGVSFVHSSFIKVSSQVAISESI